MQREPHSADSSNQDRGSKPRIRMLFFPAEVFPTNRVRLTILFGRELLGRGHAIDIVMQAANETILTGRQHWHGRTVLVGRTDSQDGFWHRLRKHALGLSHDLRCLRLAKSSAYDCILVSDKYLLGAIAAIVARLRGMRFFFWLTFAFHESHVTLGREKIARYPALSLLRGHLAGLVLHRWIVPLSHHVFVQSDFMAAEFVRRGADRKKLTAIVTGIDAREIEPVREVRRTSRGSMVTVGYLGTLARERRLAILVDTIAELRQRGVPACLLIVGDGETKEDRRAIELRAAELGVQDMVRITGFRPRGEALELLKSADVCISPIYRSATFDGASPTKLVEYLALGLPVVANSHPDQTLVIRESRGGLCVPWGARHFARAVHWLISQGDVRLASIGRQGRAWVEKNRSYAGIADEFERGVATASVRIPQ